MIKQATEIISKGADLDSRQMQEAIDEIMAGAAAVDDIILFLEALNKKGATSDELAAGALIMRKYAVKIISDKQPILDTCGTGGDNKGTFNISTVVSFVASGCGISVAKHGNRSVTSSCGSADILEAAGVNINMTADTVKKCLDQIGIAFMFAPNMHPAMKYAMPARKKIAKRTIFNILGPLTNPAGAKHQLIGVFDKGLVNLVAEVLLKLGTRHALVVCADDGLDEITTTAETQAAEVKNKQVTTYKISPLDFGIKKSALADLKGGSAPENAKILYDILKGKIGPQRDIVVLNAAAAIYAADKCSSIREGINLACESIDSAKALEKLELLKEYSNK